MERWSAIRVSIEELLDAWEDQAGSIAPREAMNLSAFVIIAATLGAPPAPATTRPPAQDTTVSGTYYLMRRGQVIARERYTRSDSLLETELVVPEQPRLRVRAVLRPDATVARLEIRVLGSDSSGGAGTLIQSSAADFEGGRVRLEQPIGTSVPDTATVPPGTIPYLHPSPSSMEQIVRLALRTGAKEAGVNIWVPGAGGGRVAAVRVTFGEGGKATLDFAGTRVELVTRADGQILGGRVPTEDLTIQRAPSTPAGFPDRPPAALRGTRDSALRSSPAPRPEWSAPPPARGGR